jgi:hypothetical protein
MSWPGWIRASAAEAIADTDGRRERPARAQADEAAKYLSLRDDHGQLRSVPVP